MMVTIFLTVYGREGMRELAQHNLAKAAYLRAVLPAQSTGARVLFEGAPRFHEFVLQTPLPSDDVNTALLDRNIIGGVPLARWYPELGPNASLWCATEVTTREQMDAEKLKDETRTDAVKRVDSKTFYLIDGVWTDSEFKADEKLPETVLKFGSDEYFAAVKQNPKLANYFALGESVVVVFEGRVYRVSGSA